jgi:hypothetical protein
MRICIWGLAMILAYLAGTRVETWLDGAFIVLLALPCILGDVRELKKSGIM